MTNNNLKNKPDKLNNFLESSSIEELDDAACVAVNGSGLSLSAEIQSIKLKLSATLFPNLNQPIL
ncbi:MAG: hypothetical protein DSM106950_39380 [Stigonema ocellatum SAG 48.90 = DSM 106950]|nr:hypothetical protein [Stigonema ocellatum SAG 48.90 = DSM 106950]